MATATVDAFFDGVVALVPPVASFSALRTYLYVFPRALGGGMVLEGVAGETGSDFGLISFKHIGEAMSKIVLPVKISYHSLHTCKM